MSCPQEEALQKVSMLKYDEAQMIRALVRCYNRIGIPFTPETVAIFLETQDKRGMVERAEEWANSIVL